MVIFVLLLEQKKIVSGKRGCKGKVSVGGLFLGDSRTEVELTAAETYSFYSIKVKLKTFSLRVTTKEETAKNYLLLKFSS